MDSNTATARVQDQRERLFFFIMACLMALIIAAGFSYNFAMGRSTFAAPPIVHLHGLAFVGWVTLYVVQNALVVMRRVNLHQRLGRVAAFWLPVMVVLGMLVTRYSLQERGGAPFFDQNQFLFSNQMALLLFAGLTAWAIVLRRDAAWHRRLMLCGFLVLAGPGFGRLLPNFALVPYACYASAFLPQVLFCAVGMVADRRLHGHVHPAWFWGLGLIVAGQAVADLLAYSPLGYAITEWVLAGTPGAERPMEATILPM